VKILTVHNRYRFRGGEDESREAEDTLLAERGHEIRQVVFDNAQINAGNALKVGLQATWSRTSYQRIHDYITVWRPDILDVHNFFPLASPSVYYAARRLNVPVVQTLHNYRILCPGANFYRNGKVCEDCTSHAFAWPGILHGCYRGSRLQTSAVAAMAGAHRLLGTWQNEVSLFFVLSEFAKRKFVEGGLPESRLVVKPNFVVDPGAPGPGGEEFLYAGRLSPEKGIRTLLDGIAQTRSPKARFRIVGDGPLESAVREAAASDARITFTGRLPLKEVMQRMSTSRAVLVPSECYETFGRAAAEALASGTPVICTDSGAVTEIVTEGETGFHFRAGDPADLARVLDRAVSEPAQLIAMRGEARRTYEARYTPERGYTLIMDAYYRAVDNP
jgi:glycosyltransferase involved in cell wall biosynthesis